MTQTTKKNIVFLPYNARMWDSMESVWQAAKDDGENCNAYVVPIPYADKNPDGSAREWHCEVNEYPDYVPVEDWRTFDLKGMHPDVIVVHNPYDDMNLVTSVEPRFYSRNLKFYTDKLVYIPYYATSGGMAEGHSLCAAYEHVDYIVIQAPKYRGFFDKSVSDEKFLPLGSPKFDRVMRMCIDPPTPPASWQEKMRGRKVFFYNTSIAGLLGDTRLFLLKLQYVFNTFKGRDDVCLLWRPHPLLESTLQSMRPQYAEIYHQLRDYYISENIGVYDDTGDIDRSIALSDAYIGDGGTSVTSLFGMAGKPMFYLDNRLHTLPEAADWRAFVNPLWDFIVRDWLIAYGNQLWYAPDHDFRFRHFCDLSEYKSSGCYGTMIKQDGKLLVCPNQLSDIIVIDTETKQIIKRVPVERRIERTESFAGAVYMYPSNDDRIFLAPMKYPAVVSYDFRHDELRYIDCDNDVFVKRVYEETWRGAIWGYEDWLYFGSPTDNKAWAINRYTLAAKTIDVGDDNFGGSQFVLYRKWGDDEYFFVPYEGRVITRINMKTGATRKYVLPENFKCHHPTKKYECDIRPFGSGMFQDENTIILSPLWGNMFVKLHVDTGVVEEWKTPFEVTVEGKNQYYFAGWVGCFVVDCDRETWLPREWHFYYAPERKRYRFDIKTEEFTSLEHDATFDEQEIRRHVTGFGELSEYAVYGCTEDVFNSLKDFIDGNISGGQFDRARQLRAYAGISANHDGTAGKNIYEFIKNH